jgi:hypothetical protein
VVVSRFFTTEDTEGHGETQGEGAEFSEPRKARKTRKRPLGRARLLPSRKQVRLGRARLLPSRKHVHAGTELVLGGPREGLGQAVGGNRRVVVASRFFTTDDADGREKRIGDGGRRLFQHQSKAMAEIEGLRNMTIPGGTTKEIRPI